MALRHILSAAEGKFVIEAQDIKFLLNILLSCPFLSQAVSISLNSSKFSMEYVK